MAQPTVAVAHLTPIAHPVRWHRTRSSVMGFSAPGWQVQVFKNPATRQFEARAISDRFSLYLGAAKLQRDAKVIAGQWSAVKWVDYAEAFNARQEAHFFAPTAEARERLESWERNVEKGHREPALLGAWTEAEIEAFERAHA